MFFPFRTPNVNKEIAGLKSPRSAERIQSVSSPSSLGSLLRCHPLVAILVASIKRRVSFLPSLVYSSRGSVRGLTFRMLNSFRSSLYNLHSIQAIQNAATKKILGVFKTAPSQPCEVETSLLPPLIRLARSRHLYA